MAERHVSVFNDVIGPVMRGPSSSHTAGSYHIARLARSLLGDEPAEATFTFDQDGSYAQVYRQQGADLSFAAGLLGWSITDDRFAQALDVAASQGLKLEFKVERLPKADHPNAVAVEMKSRGGRTLLAAAKSIGGGSVVFSRLGEWPVELTGDAHDVLVELEAGTESPVSELLTRDGEAAQEPRIEGRGHKVLVHARRFSPLRPDDAASLESLVAVCRVWAVEPIFFVQKGKPLLESAAEMVSRAEGRKSSLGQAAVDYESALLGLTESEVLSEMGRRLDVMLESVRRGLKEDLPKMQLLGPTAREVHQAEAEGKLAAGGIHARAAARAMAALHVSGGMGVVCAAPTAGAAGVLPGVLAALIQDKGLGREQAVMALFSAAAIGLIVGVRATFAAEIAGCQVEIGAAGAMGSAAVVEAAGGTAQQAADAAAISFHNTMGSVCDLVQGICEIPCHTRNAAAASGAFLCADLMLGGYRNPIPLDETIDAVLSVGKMLPPELRCTARGGLAQTPSARRMRRLR